MGKSEITIDNRNFFLVCFRYASFFFSFFLLSLSSSLLGCWVELLSRGKKKKILLLFFASSPSLVTSNVSLLLIIT
jgi:hypothetical protein